MCSGGRGFGAPHPVGGPCSGDTSTGAACLIPTPSLRTPHDSRAPLIPPPSPAHLPSPTLSRPPPPNLSCGSGAPRHWPLAPLCRSRHPAFHSSPPYVSELRSGKGPTPASESGAGGGGRGWPAALSCRSPPRWNLGSVGERGGGGGSRPAISHPTHCTRCDCGTTHTLAPLRPRVRRGESWGFAKKDWYPPCAGGTP